MSAADVLAQHRHEPGVKYDMCKGCEWRGGGVLDHAAHQLDALKAAGFAVIQLPGSPSEYWGPHHQPQWNHYPFTRVDGDEVEVGARREGVYRMNVAEARIFAADVLAAVEVAERGEK